MMNDEFLQLTHSSFLDKQCVVGFVTQNLQRIVYLKQFSVPLEALI
jgi:hypothetical protein